MKKNMKDKIKFIFIICHKINLICLSYNGTRCEILNCDVDEPNLCFTLNEDQCSVDLINSYCRKKIKFKKNFYIQIGLIFKTNKQTKGPKLCGKCPNVTTIASITTQVSRECTPLNCQNGGLFHSPTCSCRCNFMPLLFQ
jgi:hypothetical protein